MKVINKMMAIILLSGTGIGSVQARDTTRRHGLYGNASTMPSSITSTSARQPMKPNKIRLV